MFDKEAATAATQEPGASPRIVKAIMGDDEADDEDLYSVTPKYRKSRTVPQNKQPIRYLSDDEENLCTQTPSRKKRSLRSETDPYPHSLEVDKTVDGTVLSSRSATPLPWSTSPLASPRHSHDPLVVDDALLDSFPEVSRPERDDELSSDIDDDADTDYVPVNDIQDVVEQAALHSLDAYIDGEAILQHSRTLRLTVNRC